VSDESERPVVSAKRKKPIQILRERRGGVPRELVERNRRQNAMRRRLLDALGEGPKTIPELAQGLGRPAHEVLWHVMGLRKYGKVAEGEACDGYFRYELIDESRETESAS